MPYKVPDWKIYQVGKHTPELEQVQRMLGSLGLKVRSEIFVDRRERSKTELISGSLDPQ